MSEMDMTATFSGCSCGCTPSSRLTVRGHRNDVIKRLAMFYFDFAVDGDNPYNKIWCHDLCNEDEADVEKLADELRGIEKKMRKYKSKIGRNKDKAWELKCAAETLGVEIPEDKVKEIDAMKIENEESNKEIKKLAEVRRGLLRYENEVEEDEEEDYDYDC